MNSYINHQCVRESFAYLPMNDEVYHVSGWSALPRLATDCEGRGTKAGRRLPTVRRGDARVLAVANRARPDDDNELS
jgi:hypothetical protein